MSIDTTAVGTQRLTAFSPALSDVELIDAHKAHALELVSARGLPSRPQEVFKYTDTATLNKRAYLRTPLQQPDVATLLGAAGEGAPACVVTLGAAPRASRAPAGVHVSTLNAALKDGALAPGDVFYNGDEAAAGHTFWALNDAHYEGGAYIHITQSLDAPLHIVATGDADAEGPGVVFPKVVLVLDEGVRAEVVEHHVVYGGGHLSVSALHVQANAGAALTHHFWPDVAADSHLVHALRVVQHKESEVKTNAILLGEGTVRSDLDVALVGLRAEFHTTALKVGTGKAHFDTHTRIDHRVPECTSRQLERGILAGRSRSVFNGRIYFQRDAQKSDTAQLNNNLLLSDDAEVDTKPQLEIFADDVKASHGATVGQLDEDSIFYLRARGLSEPVARHLLVSAFAAELVADIENEALQAQVQSRVDAAVAAAIASTQEVT